MKSLIFLLLMISGGCATSYQPSGFGGGYSDTKLAPDVFRIYFRGNAYTSSERVWEFAMLRAAEITVSEGFKHFAIIDESSSAEVIALTSSGSSKKIGSGHIQNSHVTYSEKTTYDPPETHYLFKPKSELLIKCFPEKPDDIYTFDALFLQNSLKQKYKIK